MEALLAKPANELFADKTVYQIGAIGLSASEIVTWNDEYFIQTYWDKRIAVKAPTHTQALNYAMGCLRVIYGGNLPQDFGYEDMLKAVLLMRDPTDKEKYLFEDFFQADGSASYFRTFDSITDVKGLKLSESYLAPTDAQTLTTPVSDSMNLAGHLITQESPKEVQSIPTGNVGSAKTLVKLEEYFSKKLADSTQDYTIINYAGYLMLMMFRSRTKTVQSVMRAYKDTAAKHFCSFYNHSDADIPNLVPPHSGILPSLYNVTTRGIDNVAKTVLASVVWRYRKGLMDKSKGVTSILQAGCLVHISYSGLGTINLLIQAAAQRQQNVDTLNRYLAGGRSAETARKMRALLTHVDREKAKGMMTLPFCRLFEDEQFSSFAAKLNSSYCCKLAMFLETGNEGIFNSAALSQISDADKMIAREWYTNYVRITERFNEENSFTSEARSVVPRPVVLASISDPSSLTLDNLIGSV